MVIAPFPRQDLAQAYTNTYGWHLKRNCKKWFGIDKKALKLELEMNFFVSKELELELTVNDLELELNYKKKGNYPSPVE